jgi:hypothetical protein
VELNRVAIAGGIQQEDRRAFRDGRAVNLYIVQRPSTGKELDRRLEAKHLLDGARHQLWSPAQQLDGSWVSQTRKYAMGDEINRRIVAGDEQQHRIGGDFAWRHPPVRPVVVK